MSERISKTTKKFIRFSRDDVRAMFNADEGGYRVEDNDALAALEEAALDALTGAEGRWSLYWDTATKKAGGINAFMKKAAGRGFSTIFLIFRPPLAEIRRRLRIRNKRGGRRVPLTVAEKIWRSVNEQFPARTKRIVQYPVRASSVIEITTMDKNENEDVIRNLAQMARYNRLFVMTAGAPASGKTTFFKMLAEVMP